MDQLYLFHIKCNSKNPLDIGTDQKYDYKKNLFGRKYQRAHCGIKYQIFDTFGQNCACGFCRNVSTTFYAAMYIPKLFWQSGASCLSLFFQGQKQAVKRQL